MEYENGAKVDREALDAMLAEDDRITEAYIESDATVLVQGRDKDGNPVYVAFPLDVAALALTEMVESGARRHGIVVAKEQCLTLGDMALAVALAIDQVGLPGTLTPGSFSEGIATGDMRGAWDRHEVKRNNVRSAAFDGYL